MRLSKKKISLIMAKKELSVKDIANICNKKSQEISRLFSGANTTPKTVGKLAKALGVDVTEIIED